MPDGLVKTTDDKWVPQGRHRRARRRIAEWAIAAGGPCLDAAGKWLGEALHYELSLRWADHAGGRNVRGIIRRRHLGGALAVSGAPSQSLEQSSQKKQKKGTP